MSWIKFLPRNKKRRGENDELSERRDVCEVRSEIQNADKEKSSQGLGF
ncbi:TPA: hypothetical protein ACMDOU_003522 [Vibrio cholerae]